MVLPTARLTDDDIADTVLKYSDTLFRLCFSILCNYADAEDAVSDTMVRLIKKAPSFNDEEHKKAWLIKTASNICKDKYRFNKRHNHINIDELSEYCQKEDDNEVLMCLLKLPDKYKAVIHLFYIEGYKTHEIAKILGLSPSAVRKRLQYGRSMIKLEYERNDCL